jgi:hypothetical protein
MLEMITNKIYDYIAKYPYYKFPPFYPIKLVEKLS